MIPKKILNYLELPTGKAGKEKVKHEIVEHRKVYTALDAAATQKIKPQEVAKTLVMKVDKDYMLALVPANKNIDKKKFKITVNKYLKKLQKDFPEVKLAKKIDFAKEAWIKKNLVGKIGSIPPFGKLLKMNLFMDGSLFTKKHIYLQSGEYTQSIKITPKNFIKLEDPFKGSFSQVKK